MGLFDILKETANDLGIIETKPQRPAAHPGYNQPAAPQPAPQPATPPKQEEGLYNPQLERLIDLALADGELTEKEKQVLFKKAEAMGIDLDEFEMVLDARLYEHNKPIEAPIATTNSTVAAPTSNKFGDVKKCPACGAIAQPFSTRCTDCGHEFRNVDASQGIQRLFDMLNEVDEQLAQQDSGLLGFNGIFAEDKANKRKMSIIRNFPVPTTKEDILEFLALAVPQAKSSMWSGNIFASAWKEKCEHIILKAKLSMKDDKETLAEITSYAKQLKIKI